LRAREAFRQADLAIVLDTSEPDRVSPLDKPLANVPTIVVDHHPPGAMVLGDGGIQDPTASATGELVYDIITLGGGDWSLAAATGVYVAIVSDTGSFRFG